MPYDYQTSAAFVRTRRVKDKDKDTRSTTTSSSGRKHRETSVSSNRLPLQPPTPAQPLLHTQQTVTIDQLPPLPGSGTASPLSTKSPVLRLDSCAQTSETSATALAHFHTPAALQPFLDYDDEASDVVIPPALQTSTAENTIALQPRAVSPELNSQLLDSHTATPVASGYHQENEQARLLSNSPGFFYRPPNSHTSDLHNNPSTKAIANGSAHLTPPPPPPPPHSPFWGQPLSRSSSCDPNQPYSQSLTYVNQTSDCTPSWPFQIGDPNEHYFAPTYVGPNFIPMLQPNGVPLDFQPYCPPYGTSQQMQAPPHTLRSPSIRDSSTSSRMSPTKDTSPGISPASIDPASTAHRVESNRLEGFVMKDNTMELLQRIQNAIPNLMKNHQENADQLGDKENRIRQAMEEQTATLKQRDLHIQELRKKAEDILSKHSAESSKLRLEIGNMEEKQKGLQDSLDAERKFKSDLERMNQVIRTELEQVKRSLQESHTILARNHELSRTMASDIAVKQKTMEDSLQRQIRASEVAFQAHVAEMTKAHAQERDTLQNEWARQRREFEAANIKLRQDLKDAYESKKRDVDEGQRKQKTDREAWDQELRKQSQNWEQERAVFGKGSEEHRKILMAHHRTEKEELQRLWKQSEARIVKEAEEKSVKLQNEMEKLRADRDADKTKFTKVSGEFKAAAAKLNSENNNLQKLAEAFGAVTELKSREDPFYHDAFNFLQKQISEFAIEHFQDGPEHLPREVIDSIPGHMPSLLSNSISTLRLRGAYVEHVVSRVITQEIFEPFLFALGIHRRKLLEPLLTEWSESLKGKSISREVAWRQHMLYAAYTTSSAKQSVNKAATTIVNEIVFAIRGFADKSRWDAMTVAVRRIVKSAAETWRYARLERALITASLSEKGQSITSEVILASDYGHGDGSAGSQPRKILLPLFPIIQRERLDEDVPSISNQEDYGCIYTPGRVLYADDPIVLARLAELGSEQEQPSDGAWPVHSGRTTLGKTPSLRGERGSVTTKDLVPKSPLVGARPSTPVDYLPSVRNDGSRDDSGNVDVWEPRSSANSSRNGVAEGVLPSQLRDDGSISNRWTSDGSGASISDDGSFTPRKNPLGVPDWENSTAAVPETTTFKGGW